MNDDIDRVATGRLKERVQHAGRTAFQESMAFTRPREPVHFEDDHSCVWNMGYPTDEKLTADSHCVGGQYHGT